MATFGSPAPQWTESAAAAPSLSRGVLIRDADGDWAIAEGVGLLPEAYFVYDGSGNLVVDDTAESGLKIAVSATNVFVY